MLNRLDALCAPVSGPSRRQSDGAADALDFNDFEAEMKLLSAANQELLGQAHSMEETPIDLHHEEPAADRTGPRALRACKRSRATRSSRGSR